MCVHVRACFNYNDYELQNLHAIVIYEKIYMKHIFLTHPPVLQTEAYAHNSSHLKSVQENNQFFCNDIRPKVHFK